MYGVMLIFLLFFTYIAWRNFRVALYLILMFIPLYLLRFSVLSIPTTLLEILIYIAFLVWLYLILIKKAKFEWHIFKPYLLPIILIFLGLLVGSLVSTDKLVSIGVIKGWFVDPLLLFVMLVSSLHQVVHVKKAITALMLSGAMLSFIAIYQVISNNFITIDQRASALFSSANYLSLYLVPIIILGVGLFFSVIKPRKWWAVSSVLVMLGALYFTFSYGSWIGLIAGGIVLMLMFLPTWYTSVGSSIVLIAGLVSQWGNPKFQQMLNFSGQSSSHARLQIWQTSLLMIKEKYLTGIGLGMFEKKYMEFAKQLFENPFEQYTLHAHNVFLHFWINTGILGLIGFVVLIVKFFKQTITVFKQQKNVLLGSVIAAMVALLIHGLFDTAYWKNDLSVLFWSVLAFGIILSRNITSGKDRTNLPHRN